MTERHLRLVRDVARERAFLTSTRGDAPFVQQAEQRLTGGEREYGDSWSKVGVPHLLREAREECSDIGGWCALCDQALDHHPNLTDEQRQQLRAVLAQVAKYGADAHRLLSIGLHSVEQPR